MSRSKYCTSERQHTAAPMELALDPGPPIGQGTWHLAALIGLARRAWET